MAICPLSIHAQTFASSPPLTRSSRSRQKRKPPPFIDSTIITVMGGHGGTGSMATTGRTRIPSGGRGGMGGDVVIMCSENHSNFQSSSLRLNGDRYFKGNEGGKGGEQGLTGRDGKGKIVWVPRGVVVSEVIDDLEDIDSVHFDDDDDDDDDYNHDDYYDENGDLIRQEDGLYHHIEPQVNAVFPPLGSTTKFQNYTSGSNSFNVEKKGGVGSRKIVKLAELNEPFEHILVATGGIGGMGSKSLVGSPTRAPQNHPGQEKNKYQRRLRPARKGTTRKILLELKLLADIGMVGFPNAGKSSIMRQLCMADAKVGRYAFTTLEPRVGVVEFQGKGGGSAKKVSIADLPGLVSGASEGRGKGHKFLRHVERTKCLLFVLDCFKSGDLDLKDSYQMEEKEHQNGVKDLKSLLAELKKYDEADTRGGDSGGGDYSPLATRNAVIAVNKLDLLSSDEERVEAVERVRGWVDDVFSQSGWGEVPVVVGISCANGFGMQELAKSIFKMSQ